LVTDGENIAIVSEIETFVDVAIYNLKINRLRTIYSGRTNASIEAYLYVVNWFSDGKRMLIAGSDGIRIINTETKEETVLSKEPAAAYLSGDGKKIIYGPRLNKIQLGIGGRLKSPSEIYQYDTEKGKSELLMSLDATLAVLSQDGRYLVSQTVALKEASISIVDLLEKKVSKVDTKRLFLIPKRFSPFSKDFVICMGLQENEDTIQYGILNLNNGEFRVLKESSSKGFEGEKGLILFMGFDWYDWR
jgi:hypothetical protein